MAKLTEGRHAGEFLLSEASYTRSRDNILISGGQGKLKPGLVLAKATAGAATSAAKVGGNTGAGTLGTLSAIAGAMLGVYAVRFSSATAYTVTDPVGRVVGAGANGTPFPGGQIVFTTTASGAAFVAGDGFDVTVTAVAGEYQGAKASGSNGLDTGVAILIGNADGYNGDLDTSEGRVPVAAITRDAEVNGKCLEYDASVNDATKKAAKATQLAAAGVGIIVR